MGIYGALSSAVTGLRAQAHALENISGNIANSQTTGYKRIETDFLDLIPDAPISRQVPGAVLAQSRGTNNVQGDIKTVSDETFIALNSNGFFVVEPKIGQSDGNAVFAGTNFFTRRGDFEIDKDGLLVNGAGYYLKGLPIDTLTGNISGSVPEVIRLSNNFLPAQKTNRINYQANLPQLPKNTGYVATIPNSELLNTSNYGGVAATATGDSLTVPASAAGYAIPDGTIDALGAGFADGQTLSLTVNGVTRTLEFHNNDLAGVAPGNIGVDIQPGQSIDDVMAAMQAAIQAGGGGFTTATVGAVNGSLRIGLGDNITDTLTLGGTAMAGLSLSAGPYSAQADTALDALGNGFVPGQTLTFSVGSTTHTLQFHNNDAGSVTAPNIGINIQPGNSIGDVIVAMQAALRSTGGDFSSATVSANASNELVVSMGGFKTSALTVGGTAAAGLGLGGVHNNVNPPSRLATISAANDAQFKANSIAGGAITVYAENGAPANVQMRWAKIDSAASGGADTWNLFYMSDSSATGTQPMWTNVGQDYVFAGDGSIAPPGLPTVMISDLEVNGVEIGDVELKHDTNGISQFADVNGTANVSTLNQNGYGAGEFVSVAINDSGRVVATYSNGERIDMAQVVTAEFNAINKLKRLDGGVFSSTSESGEAILDLSGSGVIGGALEASNTDISDEFTKLIVTQQAYAAGTRIVSTADEMLQEALNMIR
ncbi:MAG: flagellar hook-basal body complex protein [Alphaproteobacteria bacterium]|nr:flagellar hook-basal body complex protein [Alphaproteobacteria bacterium]MBU1559790.1 flagellar hook-basal body complex protein [Alphaproteobacteria bacterium]MBU2301057.1 flagellar hook-basal body complex protein [Alphaproteobacteria bacterium]MBU2368873.1 flagellar hook-basal body complex protein [Alphaproteobacteria bacterium]